MNPGGTALTMLKVLTILLACLPPALIVTILMAPFWSWIETAFEVEAYGHSGPAQWCYGVTYGLLVVICLFVWMHKRNIRPKPRREEP